MKRSNIASFSFLAKLSTSMEDPANKRDPLGSDTNSPQLPASLGDTEPSSSALSHESLISLELRPEQWATAEELSRLDVHLAGLYRLGLALLPRIPEPGVSYVIAHIGRELSRGVVNLLSGSGVALHNDGAAEIPDNERNRVAIGTVLQLPPSHPLVTKWFRLHSTFARSVHFRQPGPNAENVRSAFLELSELLFGRIGPYFATHAQLDALLSIDEPDDTTVERARPMLARPVQRQYFFNTLARAGWLEPLAAAGQFSDPPEMIDLGDGRWHIPQWPEGEYLVKMASHAPERVTEIFLKLPKNLKNPVIWSTVARAAIELPATLANRLIGHLESALKNPVVSWFTLRVIPVVRKFAEERQKGAFRLAASLLWVNEQPSSGGQERLSTGLRPMGETEWVMARLDSFTLRNFLTEAVPALESFKPHETVALLSKTLDRAIRVIEGEVGNEQPDYLRASTLWCPQLHKASDRDARAQLAVSLASVATRVAAIGKDDAVKILEMLQKRGHEIFQRIIIAVLTVAGEFLPEQLDDAIINPKLTDFSVAPREYASLLRAQFNNASPRAQRLFVYTLERGPEPEMVKSSLGSRKAEPTGDNIQEIVAHWQRRRMRWFQDRIPEILLPLAERLGVESKKLSERERALNEEGFYSGGMTWVGDPSPVSDEEIAAMSTDELIKYLESWNPDTTSSIDSPTMRGLEHAVSRYTLEYPEAATNLANRLMASSASPRYLSALLGGFKDAFEQGRTIPWQEVLGLAAFIIRRANQDTPNTGNYDFSGKWYWAEAEALRFIEKGCAGNYAPIEYANAIWKILDEASTSPSTWEQDNVSESFTTFDSILNAALNTLSGQIVETLINVALWKYRHTYPGEDGKEIRDSSVVTPRLVPLLEKILDQDGRAGIIAQAMLGRFLPQILLMARAWTLQSSERLFADGAASPLARPLWGSFVTSAQFYDSVFQDLRLWYVVAAGATVSEDSDMDSHDRSWGPSRHLAVHVLIAVLRGLASVGDNDELVELTFRNVRVEDRVHAYWNTFRSWTDGNGKISSEVTERLALFWEWRLRNLESGEETDERIEEAIGLRWLLATPHLPASDALRLGIRTIDLAGADVEDRGAPLWDRLGELAQQDASGTYELIERLIQEALARDFPYLPFESISPMLVQALNCGDGQIKKRAERLINTLGEHGLYEYGKLISSGGETQ